MTPASAARLPSRAGRRPRGRRRPRQPGSRRRRRGRFRPGRAGARRDIRDARPRDQQRRRVPRPPARARARRRARRLRGRDRQRLRARRQAGRRLLQGPQRGPPPAARAGQGGAGRLQPLVDPLGAAGRELRRRRARQPRARRRRARARASRAGERHRGRDRLRDLPADRRPAAPAAADHARCARRAAVHHRAPGLRALVQADPARARHRSRRARRRPPARRRAAAAARGRHRAAAAGAARRARDDGTGGVPRVPRPARSRLRVPVAPVPRDRVALGRARDVARRRRPAGRPVALRGVLHRARAARGPRSAPRGARGSLPRPHRRPAARGLARRRGAAGRPRRGAPRAGATTTR